VLTIVLGLSAGDARAQAGAAAGGARMAEEAFKNIQVLKGVPAEQIPATMQFVAASLGVQCTYCHVQGANEKDDKEDKLVARRMMQMVLDVNKNHFNGRAAISCYTCHRGNRAPVGVPVLGDVSARPSSAPAAAEGSNQPQAPSPEQLLDKYLSATGGVDNIAKISSRVAKGTSQDAGGNPYPAEVFFKSPDQGLTVVNISGSNSSVGYSGSAGWTANATRGIRDMTTADLQGAQLESDLYLATRVKQLYSQWRAGRADKIGDRDAYVLNGTAPGRKPVRLYLDQQTGMLLRLMHFTETPLGRLPTQVDYADYRDVDGVKVPFRITTIRPTSRTTLQLDQVQQNVAVEDSKFVKPTPPPQP